MMGDEERIPSASSQETCQQVTSFICQCGQQFSSNAVLQQHIGIVHGSGPRQLQKTFICECGGKYLTSAEMKLHKKKDHPRGSKVPMDCKKCNKTFTTIGHHMTHLNHFHKDDLDYWLDIFKCTVPKCPNPLDAKSRSDMAAHNRKYHPDPKKKKYQCHQCKEYFTQPDILSRHVKVMHPGYMKQNTENKAGSSEAPQDNDVEHLKSQFVGKSIKPVTAKLMDNEECFMCECGKQFTSDEFLSKHIANVHCNELDIVRSNMTCKCGKQFESHNELRQHIKLEHSSNTTVTLDCVKCKLQFNSIPSQMHHLNSIHKEDQDYLKEIFKCHELNCPSPLDAKNRTEMKAHIRRCHSKNTKKNFQCKHCGEFFSQHPHLKQHVNNKHVSKNTLPKYLCVANNCGGQFHRQKEFEEHVRKSHPEERNEHLYCPFCNKYCNTSDLLSRHIKRFHQGSIRDVRNQEVKCRICSTSFMQQEIMSHFIQEHEGLKNQVDMCISCGKQLSNKQSLHGHVANVHSKDNEVLKWYYTCKIDNCAYVGKSRYDLAEHQRTEHNPADKYYIRCPNCNVPYKSMHGMLVHYHKQHGEISKHASDLMGCRKGCNYIGKNWSDLRRHEAKHRFDAVRCLGCNEERPWNKLLAHVEQVHRHEPRILKLYFTCLMKTCNKWFGTLKKFNNHKNTHSHSFNSKLCTCTKCNQTFKNVTNKKRHDRMYHSANHTLRCNNCDYSSNRCESHMKHVLENHTGFKCMECPKEFLHQSTLLGHVRTAHPIPGQPHGRIYTCKFPGCFVKEKTRRLLRTHVEQAHGWILKMENACHLCKLKYPDRTGALYHVNKHHVTENDFKKAMLTCCLGGCKFVGSNLIDLRRHRLTHKKRDARCFLSYTKPKSCCKNFKCTHNDCQIEFKSRGQLRSHLYNADLEMIYFSCFKCDKTFASRHTRFGHQKVCKGSSVIVKRQRKQMCDRPGCKERLYRSPEMQNHVFKFHVANGDGFQCRICGRFFSSRRNMFAHVKRVHEEMNIAVDEENPKNLHVFKVIGSYEVNRCFAVDPSRFSCLMCHASFGTRNCLLAHVKHQHHNGRRISRRFMKNMTEEAKDLACMKCKTKFPCTLALQHHHRSLHGSKKRLVGQAKGHMSTAPAIWCDCCKFNPPSSEFCVGDPYNVGGPPTSPCVPLIVACLSCLFTTTSLTEAFVHIEDNFHEPFDTYPAASDGVLGPKSYEYCDKCKMIFLSDCDYLAHLERKHWPKYIEEFIRIYPELVDDPHVVNYYKYAGESWFDVTDPFLAQKIIEAARHDSQLQ